MNLELMLQAILDEIEFQMKCVHEMIDTDETITDNPDDLEISLTDFAEANARLSANRARLGGLLLLEEKLKYANQIYLEKEKDNNEN